MYETICPSCRRMIELPAQVAIVGARSKCPKCWTHLETISGHPLRLTVASSSNKPIHADSGK